MYRDDHYAKVAALYNETKSAKSVQDHFPNTSLRSVQRWIRACRNRGLIG